MGKFCETRDRFISVVETIVYSNGGMDYNNQDHHSLREHTTLYFHVLEMVFKSW